MTLHFNRRRALKYATAAGIAGLSGLRTLFEGSLQGATESGYGELIPDTARPALLDLPRGFQYHAFSRTADAMDDGFRVPGAHDGMAAFPGPRGATILIRNHEMLATGMEGVAGTPGSPYFGNPDLYRRLEPGLVYDRSSGSRPGLGGTTTLLYNTAARKLERHFLSLTGTIRNCAGGPTPWGSWISCEETTVSRDGMIGDEDSTRYSENHGYVFEVPVSDAPQIARPFPLKALGRFSHEALAVDPRTGIVYETEDAGSSLFYRFLPNERGNLRLGGKLQALRLKNGVTNTANRPDVQLPVGVPMEVEWADLKNVEEPDRPLSEQAGEWGAARFSRGEGCWFGNGAIYFACTNGGASSLGQIFKYTPSPAEGTPEESKAPALLELFIEPNDESVFAAPDNLAIAPWGDIVVCEDGSGVEYVHGITPHGQVYKLARNAFNESEFAGACFSPDGSTLFVNIQTPGITFAITGPWNRRLAGAA